MFTKKQLVISVIAVLVAAFLKVTLPSSSALDIILMLVIISLGSYLLYTNQKKANNLGG